MCVSVCVCVCLFVCVLCASDDRVLPSSLKCTRYHSDVVFTSAGSRQSHEENLGNARQKNEQNTYIKTPVFPPHKPGRRRTEKKLISI